jgi:prepilin peptidase CpaA
VPLSEIVRFSVASVATGVLAFAAVSDVRARRIPNWTVLALLGLFVAWSFANGGASLVSSLEAGGIALLVTIALYALRVVGAGDSKLFTVCALFAGMGYLPYLALITSLVGGAIAIISLVSRPRRAMVLIAMRGKGDWGRGVPYGLAIAASAAIVTWAGLTGLLDPFGYFNRHGVTAHTLSSELAGHSAARR